MVTVALAIFVLAVGVRLFHWQDNRPILPRLFSGMVDHHKANASLLLRGDVAGFIKGPAPPGDANILTYPPGYPIVMASVFKLFGDSDASMRIFQITCDAVAAVLLFFLALELLPWKVAAIAGAWAALSPQLAYYSLILIPDSLVTLPILLALYFLIRAVKHDSLRSIAAAGIFIGLSCWLRSNQLLLAPFLALLLLLILKRPRRWRFATVLVGATLVVIAPITIRNLIVFHQLVPLSVGAGQMLTVGITDYDKQRRFGLPGTDIETVTREAEIYGRPEYAHSLFGGDGFARERDRMSRALAVVRSHPAWFAGVVLRRAVSMLKFERVHVVSFKPAVTNSVNITSGMKPAWSLEPSEFIARSANRPPRISPAANGNAIRLQGHEIDSANMTFVTSFPVEANTDYLLRLPIKVEQGSVVLSVLSPDQQEVYSSTPVLNVLETLPGVDDRTQVVLPFVSRDNGDASLLIENEKRKPGPMVLELGKMELFRLGPASLAWTKYVRAVVHFAQKLFITAWMIPLAFFGAVLFYAARGGKFLLLLLAIPLYYLSAQSFLHTEYRYVMSIQPAFFILIALTLYAAGQLVRHTVSSLLRAFKRAGDVA